MDYSQGNRQKKEKREDRIKEKFFMGGIIMWTIVKEIDRKKRKERTELKKSFLWGGIIMLEKRNYVQIG